MRAVKAGSLSTYLAMSTVASGGIYCKRNGARENVSPGEEKEERSNALRSLAGAASGAETKAPPLRKRSASLAFQHAHLHAR